jgi:Flp pilus assembly protein CpaB
MTALIILGALLWSFVLFAVLRRLAERRAAQRAYAARCAERDRQWWQAEAERVEVLHAAQHVMLLARLEELR